MARGSAVHKAVALLDDLYGSGLYWPSVDPSLVPYLMAWQDCKAEVIEQPHRTNLLVDIKTGVPHARHQLQTAAYKVALINPRRGMMPPRDALIEHRVVCFRHGYAGTLDRYYPASKYSMVVKRLAVYLHPDGTYRVKWHEDVLDEAAFVGMAQAWHWLEKYGRRKEQT